MPSNMRILNVAVPRILIVVCLHAFIHILLVCLGKYLRVEGAMKTGVIV